MSDPIKILVVCTGNLCRSPLVAALLDRELTAAGIEAEVSSAGLAAPVGAKPDRKMLKAAIEVGIDLSRHRSRNVDPLQLGSADIVLAMTASHVRQLKALMPGVANRVAVLRAAGWKASILWDGGARDRGGWIGALARGPEALDHDLADPVGKPLKYYRRMASEAEAVAQQLVSGWPRT